MYTNTNTEIAIAALKELAGEYSKTAAGKWLSDFDWRAVPVKFAKLGHGIVGCHSFGRIYLLETVDIGLVFDIYIHELRHVWQWKKKPMVYLIGKLYRPLIERDADEKEKEALDWYLHRH